MNLTIGYLYGDLMNIYGDTGNIIALKKRGEWRGIEVKVKNISLKDKLKPGDVDIFFFGGGQDQAQGLVAKDLQEIKGQRDKERKSKAQIIKGEVERGVPLLAICGGYQLLGESYKPHERPKLMGVGLFPVYTVAGEKRMVGNIVVDYSSFIVNRKSKDERYTTYDIRRTNFLVGFENHSGKTYLKEGAEALGTVIKGFGNNGEDKSEGCIYKNAIGCYMHGSLLPKNPHLADWLLQKALEVKYGNEIKLESLEDSFEEKAHEVAIQKFG